ncbi:Pre-mRNA-splicing factor cwc26 [Malassezia cuniculi]|uniref:Pre-mRNA-splicing factor cwc26 n=1 Tax=Malassezia cuniculi TaxID=948313 RepID=A0AAF0J7D0_9BASI|nr:Pre-mRNA-splicing factor cwc26 [Malassezia cuniculi]
MGVDAGTEAGTDAGAEGEAEAGAAPADAAVPAAAATAAAGPGAGAGTVGTAAAAAAAPGVRYPKLQLYLAQHYYSGPKADVIAAKYGDDRKKKKKKKTVDEGALTIRDESDAWPAAAEEEEEQIQVPHEAPKPNASSWATVRREQVPTNQTHVQTESQEQEHAEHAQPAASADASAPPAKPRAGLMTREEIRAQREARRAAEEAQREKEIEEDPHETVYRDEQGRRIDVAEQERITREALEAEAQKEKERATWTQGLAQRREREAQDAELRKLRAEGFTRYVFISLTSDANDTRMNEALRDREHWDDPARAYLTRKRGPRVTRPQYKGPPPPPNRFGIKPGYRWDGVDRGNGFERKLFAAISERERRRETSQSWAMQDM